MANNSVSHRRTSRAVVLFTVLAAIFLVSAAIFAGQTKEPDYDRILTTLFPKTASWIPVNSLPRLNPEEVKKLQPELTRAFLASKLNDSEDRNDFIKRLFFNANSTILYRFDVDVDGGEDIVYAGECFGATWNTTIIWFNGDKDFIIRQGQWWAMEALRIAPGKPAFLGSVAPGCCGEMDEYYQGDSNNPKGMPSRSGVAEPARVYQSTIIPSTILKPTKFTAPDDDLVLRYSPEIDDKYNVNISRGMDCAVFGNILAKYIAGCWGTILGEKRDKDGGRWYFVRLDEKCLALRSHYPYNVNAGWIKASPGIIIQ